MAPRKIDPVQPCCDLSRQVEIVNQRLDKMDLVVGNLAIDGDRFEEAIDNLISASYLLDRRIDFIDDAAPFAPSLDRPDPFAGPVVPLLMGVMAIAGVAGAVIDGVGMAARAVRRA